MPRPVCYTWTNLPNPKKSTHMNSSTSQDRKILLGIGQCHTPSIPNESILEITRCSSGDVTAGDIIVYSGLKSLVCHRVLFRKYSDGIFWYLTKADNTLIDDGWIPAYRIVGKVTRINHKDLSNIEMKLWSKALLLRSRAQFFVFRCLFCSNVGTALRRLRERYLSPRPFVSQAFLKWTSPWAWRLKTQED